MLDYVSRRRKFFLDELDYPADPTKSVDFSTVNLRRGLVAYWRLDSGGADSSLNGLTLTNNNSVSFSNAGKVGNCGTFVAVNSQRLSITHDNRLMFSTQMSIAMWVRPSGVGSSLLRLFDKSAGTNSGYSCLQNQTRVAFIINNNGNRYGSTDLGTLAANTWAHVAAVYDGGQSSDATKLKIYINGLQRTLTFGTDTGTSAVPSSIAPNTTNFAIGANPSGLGNFFNGLIDEVVAYNRVLLSAEISEVYARGSAGKRIW